MIKVKKTIEVEISAGQVAMQSMIRPADVAELFDALATTLNDARNFIRDDWRRRAAQAISHKPGAVAILRELHKELASIERDG